MALTRSAALLARPSLTRLASGQVAPVFPGEYDKPQMKTAFPGPKSTAEFANIGLAQDPRGFMAVFDQVGNQIDTYARIRLFVPPRNLPVSLDFIRQTAPLTK